MDVQERNKAYLEAQFDKSVDAFENPAAFDSEWLLNLYDSLIHEARQSIKLYQEDLVHLTRMRDKYLRDYATLELIYNNINLLNEVIREEAKNIDDYRRTKRGRGKS
jgi:ribosome-binding protein aMBF1 (putative translation factor)